MVNSNLAAQPQDDQPAAPSPAERKLSSARLDEEVPRGEFWVLLRSVAVVIGLVVGVGWIIG